MSTLDTALRIFPRLHRPAVLATRGTEHRELARAWLVFVSGFFEPLFYLLALGVGVGALVGTVELGGETVSYREFVAPALLAASAMNGAVYESGNVFFKLKYARTYDGVLATPMTVRDVAVGELLYTLLRGAVYAVGFVTVMLVARPRRHAVGAARGARLAAHLGGVRGALGVQRHPHALVGGLRVRRAAARCRCSSSRRRSSPADEYPDVAAWILPLTPLYHGVELLRAFTLGDVTWLVLVNVAYLVAMTAVSSCWPTAGSGSSC